MNTNNFLLPKEYPIMLAIDGYYYIDVHIFDSKLSSFPRFSRVLMLRSTLSIIARRCLKSLEVKSEA